MINKDFAKKVREVLKKEFKGFKFSITSDVYTLKVKILSGNVDFSDILKGDSYAQINHYCLDNYDKHTMLLRKLYNILSSNNLENYDTSDYGVQPSYYINIQIGSYDKPYIFKK